MRRRVRLIPLLVATALVVAACSDDEESSSSSTVSTPDATGATESSSITNGTNAGDGTDDTTVDAQPAGDGFDDPTLPELDDVTAPIWVPEDRSEELALEIEEADEVTVQMAVDAAALLAADFPGATPTPMEPGEGLGATYTLALLRQVRDQLTPEQRAYLDEVDNAPVTATIADDGEVVYADELGPGGTTSGFAAVVQPPSASVTQRYVSIMDGVRKRWKTKRPTETDTITGYQLVLADTRLVGDKPGGSMAASLVENNVCRVLVGTILWRNPSRTDDYIADFFAHEMFHCIQQNIAGKFPNMGWVREGSADWAMVDLFRDLYTVDIAETTYFTKAVQPLQAGLGYDRWPLFELPLRANLDPYSVIREMLLLDETSTTEQYLAKGRMDELLFRMDWTSSTARLRGTDDRTWLYPWPGPQPQYGPHDQVLDAPEKGIGTFDLVHPGKWSHAVYRLHASPDVGIMSIKAGGDPLTLLVGARTITLSPTDVIRLCFAPDGCRCPKGLSANALVVADRSVVVGLPARANTTRSKVKNERWDPEKKCREEEPKKALSNGDPHLQSFDGLRFDSMTLGEFVYALDPAGGFEVQARHEAGGLPGAASTGAVAVSDGTDRVTFAFSDEVAGLPVVRANGEVRDEREFAVGELSVTTGDEPTVTWPDGSRIDLRGVFGWWFFDLEVPGERGARLVGMLGNADDDLRDDLRLPDGTVLDTTATVGTESQHALAWQVDEDTTLFDYADGESIATFRIPHPNPEPITPAQDDVERCKDGLGPAATESEVEWCAYDVAASGEDDFVEVYADAVEQRVDEQRAAESPPDSVPSTTTTGPDAREGQQGTPTVTMEGVLAAPYSSELGGEVVGRLEGTFDATAGTVLLSRTASCDTDTTLTLTITHRNTGASTFTFLCDPNGVNGATADADDEVVYGEVPMWLSSPGTYDLVLESDSEQPLPVLAEYFVDPTPTIVASEDLAGASVELSGVGDTVVFELGLDEGTYAVDGLDVACAIVSYGAPPLGEDGPWSLSHCGHVTGPVGLGNAGVVIPLVVWTRTADPVEVTLTAQ